MEKIVTLPDPSRATLERVYRDAIGPQKLRWEQATWSTDTAVYSCESDGTTYLLVGGNTFYAVPTQDVSNDLTAAALAAKYPALRAKRFFGGAEGRETRKMMARVSAHINQQLSERIAARLGELIRTIPVPQLKPWSAPQTAGVVELVGRKQESVREKEEAGHDS